MQPEQQLPQNEPEVPDSEPISDDELNDQPGDDLSAIRWQAPEYIQHPRPPIWFIGFWACVVLLMAVAAFVIKSWSFVILVPAMAVALMIYSHRPPRVMNYVLSRKGVYINDQLHPLTEFRNFGVQQGESLPALVLTPVKRFRPGLTVYFPPENGESIVDLLGAHIPMQEVTLDAFDKIVRKLRM
jgi:hypothetical protein